MHEKDIESLFQEITENIEFEEPSLDILELSRCILHVGEAKLLLDRLMAEVLVKPELLFQADEDLAILVRDIMGVSDELASMLSGCTCAKCQGCMCEEDETCEICEPEDE